MAIILGAGSQLQLNISGTYTAVANLVSIDGPNISVNDVDVTVLSNSSDMYKRFLAGFADGGEVTVEMRYDHIQFQTLVNNLRTANTWRIVFSDASKWDFSGYLKALSDTIPLEEDVGAPFTIKVSGAPTFTP